MADKFGRRAHLAVGDECLAGPLEHKPSIASLSYQMVGAPSVASQEHSFETEEIAVNIGILGTGNLAVTLGQAWAPAGHSLLVTGRDSLHAKAAADQIGPPAKAVDPTDLATRVDALVVAVPWEGLEEALSLVGAPEGSLAGKAVIDCTNPVDYTTCELKPTAGSAAALVAHTAPGAHVVKALHLFAGASWPYVGPQESAPVVAICGDDSGALDRAAALIQDLGARPVVVGGLNCARQLEEAAGFVMRVVMAGYNPRLAVPDVDPALLRAAQTAID
ncbi:NAD(P)-binding domain-containing protein [Nonomuraea sp. NPDC049750]|uniref:NADPH-dependent F420 reductase n=1 Tax=Nonomuraea sp. NPDC049750 TaxID=3154738 RepID=UPI0033C5B6F1